MQQFHATAGKWPHVADLCLPLLVPDAVPVVSLAAPWGSLVPVKDRGTQCSASMSLSLWICAVVHMLSTV